MRELVNRILSGDSDAYREIVSEYAPMIRVYLSSQLRDKSIVEDLLQEILVAVYWGLDKYDCDLDFGVWVRTIMRNKLRSYFRSYYSKKNSVHVLKAEISEELLDGMVFNEKEEKEIFYKLHECIKKQPEDTAEIVRARYFEKRSVNGLAEKLSTTASAISSLLYRAKKQLKTCIEKGS